MSNLSDKLGLFDTIVSLTVIEHVQDPSAFLGDLAGYLADMPNASLTVTTSHPNIDWAHDLGASFGLFSRHASEEHEDLLDKRKLTDAGTKAGLKMESYRQFLFFANQLALYKRRS